MRKKVYISGKISGQVDLARVLFETVEHELYQEAKQRGIKINVINPFKIKHKSDSWFDCMVADIRKIRKSHVMFLLPQSEGSFGVKVEIEECSKLVIPVFENTGELFEFLCNNRLHK